MVSDRPLECALCHRERSVEALVTSMESWWGKRYDRQALRALYGDDLEVNVLTSTLARGKPHEQAVAIAVLGEADDERVVPRLLPHLAHRYPLVRYYARQAIETLVRQPIPIDVSQSPRAIAIQAQSWLAGRLGAGAAGPP